jgi:hypothetical protein
MDTLYLKYFSKAKKNQVIESTSERLLNERIMQLNEEGIFEIAIMLRIDDYDLTRQSPEEEEQFNLICKCVFDKNKTLAEQHNEFIETHDKIFNKNGRTTG